MHVRALQYFAEHYGVAILPARVRMPRDKPKIEVVVHGSERRLLAPLRKTTFLSLTELNTALFAQLGPYNDRALSREAGTRRSRFFDFERPALRPLPARRYHLATWKRTEVHLDYHVEVERGETPSYLLRNPDMNYPIELGDTNLLVKVNNLAEELCIVNICRGIVAGSPQLAQCRFGLRIRGRRMRRC